MNSLTTLNSKNTNQPPKKRSKRIPQPPKIPNQNKNTKRTKTKRRNRKQPSNRFHSNNSASNLNNINNILNVKYTKYKLPSLNTVNKLEYIYENQINLIDKYLKGKVDKIKVYHITFKKNLTSIFTTGLNIDYRGTGINGFEDAVNEPTTYPNSEKLIYLTILPPLLALYVIIYFNRLDENLYKDESYYNRIYTYTPGDKIEKNNYDMSLSDEVLLQLVADFEVLTGKLKTQLNSNTSNKSNIGLDLGIYIPVILEITLDKTFKNNISITREYNDNSRKHAYSGYYDGAIGLTCNKTIPPSCIKVIKMVEIDDVDNKYNATSKDIIKFFYETYKLNNPV